MSWKDTLVADGLKLGEGFAESKLVDVLATVYAKDPEEHKIIVEALNLACKKLKPYTDGTTSKIDDVVLEIVEETIAKSAADFSLTL